MGGCPRSASHGRSSAAETSRIPGLVRREPASEGDSTSSGRVADIGVILARSENTGKRIDQAASRFDSAPPAQNAPTVRLSPRHQSRLKEVRKVHMTRENPHTETKLTAGAAWHIAREKHAAPRHFAIRF